MSKIFKISGYYIDPNGDWDNVDVKDFLEEHPDLIAKHISVEEKDIGEWDDDHPLNYKNSDIKECEKYFNNADTNKKENTKMLVTRTTKTETDKIQLGDVFDITLNDKEPIQLKAVREDSDGMVCILVDCLEKEYTMYELEKVLNGEILDRFPADLRNRMIPFSNGTYLRLPTEKEIFGENIYGEKESKDVQQFFGMEDRRNRIAYQGSKTNTYEWYWLSTKAKNSAAYFAFVHGGGNADYHGASYRFGVRPALKIRNP